MSRRRKTSIAIEFQISSRPHKIMWESQRWSLMGRRILWFLQ